MSARHVVTRVTSNRHMKGVRFGVFRKTQLCVSPTNSDSHVRSCTRDMEQWHPTKDTVMIHHDSWSDGKGAISSLDQRFSCVLSKQSFFFSDFCFCGTETRKLRTQKKMLKKDPLPTTESLHLGPREPLLWARQHAHAIRFHVGAEAYNDL